MIQLVEILALSTLLLAPALVAFAFLAAPALPGARVFQITNGLLGGLILVSLASAIHLDEFFRVEFLWPISGESSGHFNFSLVLNWERLCFIAMVNLCLLLMSQLGLDRPLLEDSGANAQRSGALLIFSSTLWTLMITVENFTLAVLFFEGALFFAHLWLCISHLGGRIQERAAFLKRLYFGMASLVLMIAFALVMPAKAETLIVLGVVFYGMGLLLSRGTMSSWAEALILALLVFGWMAMVSRAVAESGPGGHYLYLGVLLGILALAALIFSMLGSTWGNSLQWLLFGATVVGVSLRFFSRPTEAQLWMGHEVMVCAVLFTFVLSAKILSKNLPTWSALALALLQMAVLMLASPGMAWVEVAGGAGFFQQPLVWSVTLAAQFLLALALSKILASAHKQSSDGGARASAGLLVWLFAVLILMAAIGRVIFMRASLGAVFSTLEIERAGVLILIFVGYIAGAVWGANARRVEGAKELKLEGIFPRFEDLERKGISLGFLKFWNHSVGAKGLIALPQRGVVWAEQADRRIYSELLMGSQRWLMDRLSWALASFGNGNMQLYFVFAIFVMMAAISGIYLAGASWGAR